MVNIMSKQFFFLAGLHRSGNTVLASILNQNPDFYVSPLSSLVQHMWNAHSHMMNSQNGMINSLDVQRSIYMTGKMIDLYYEDVNKPIIFDRNKAWANPGNIDLLRFHLNVKPKIIFTTRPILEIIASKIHLDKDGLLFHMRNDNFIEDSNLTEDENLADYLASDMFKIEVLRSYFLQSLDNPQNDGIIHVVKYEDLLNSPQKTMDKIYNFLELDLFEHDFNNIQQIEGNNEFVIGLPKDLHKIRKEISKSNVRVEDYLSQYTIDKYKDVRYF